MYILDTNNYRVLKWQSGDPLGYIVAGGNGNGGGFNQISTSYAFFVDAQFNIYISDSSNCRVTKWSVTNTTAGVLVISILIRDLFIFIYLSLGGWWQWCR